MRHGDSSNRNTGAHQARLVSELVGLYLAVSFVTLVVLGGLSAFGSNEATSSAWTHAVIVALFTVLLEMRMRAALRGSRRASVAVPIIATVLLVANIIEAAAPGAFPTWMRFEMVAIAALMGGAIIKSIQEPGVEVMCQKLLGDSSRLSRGKRGCHRPLCRRFQRLVVALFRRPSTNCLK